MFRYTNDTSHEVKRYLQVRLVPEIDRSTEEGDAVWKDMIDHPCFNGNDSMMVFERFWGQCVNLDRIEELGKDGYHIGVFERFMTRKLHEWGYRYDENGVLCYTPTGETFDGTLLNITW